MSVTRPRARAALGVLLALAWLAAASVAAAHAELQATFPEAGATVDALPAQVAARFSEAIEDNSSIELIGPDGASLAKGGVDPADPRRLIVDVPASAGPGEYEVRWVVFSDDGHQERDTFTFTVSEPTPAPTASPSAAPSAPPPSASPTTAPTLAPLPSPTGGGSPAGGSGTDVLLPLVAVVVLVAALGVFLLRGRSRRPT